MLRSFVLVLIFLLPVLLMAQTSNQPLDDLNTLAKRIEKLEESQEKKQKDFWDKLNAGSGIISGVIVALIGFYAANIYNRRQKQHEERIKDQQLSLGQADTLEKFLPHLISDDPRLRESALLIISTLLGDDIAAELAAKLGGKGSAAALVQIASASSKRSSESVKMALGKIFDVLEPAVVRIVHGDGTMIANGFFYSDEGLVVTPAHVADTLSNDFALQTSHGNTFKGTVVYSNKDLDLALIETPNIRGISGVPPETVTTQIGTKVVSLWHLPQTGLRGEVGSIVSTQIPSTLTKRPEIGVTKMGSPGISGAPVIDTSGKLVGVVHASIQGDDPVTLLVPVSSITECLADYRSKG
jgi:hypothetical protein